MKYVIGADIGTTNLKAGLYDTSGQCLSSAARRYETNVEKSRAEQNPEDWWRAFVEVLGDIAEECGAERMKDVCAVCISSQTPTLLPLDSYGNPLRNAIIWMDRRADNELSWILSKLGEERCVQITGAKPDVSFLPAKLLWYRQNEPELFEKTRCFLQVSSFIVYRLTGKFSMDIDQAALTQCIDIKTGTWSDEIGSTIGVEFEQYFPNPVPAETPVGSIKEDVAALLGLSCDTLVLAGTSDAIAAMNASGLVRLGEATEVAGTSSLVFAGTETPPDYHTVGAQKSTMPGVPYIFNSPISSTGASFKWYFDTIGCDIERLADEEGIDLHELMGRWASRSPAGSGGVIYFPYLMGERAPLWNSHAKGMFIGLSASTTRYDIARAIFEGTAFALRDVISEFERNGTKTDSLRVVGGGARNDLWLKIKASVLGVPVLVVDKKSGDVPFGDALIAWRSCGVYDAGDNSMIEIERVIDPDPSWVEIYNAIYPYYKEFYWSLDEGLKSYEQTLKNLEGQNQAPKV